MFDNPQSYFFTLLFLAAIFWFIPRDMTKTKAFLLIFVSWAFIFIISPLALLALIVITFTGLVTIKLALRADKNTKIHWIGVWIIVLQFFGFQYMSGLAAATEGVPRFVVVLGMSYVCFRTVACVLNVRQYRRNAGLAPTFTDLFLLNSFFPIVPSGPIEDLNNLREKSLAVVFDPSHFVYGLMRVAVGFFMVVYVGNEIFLPKLGDMQVIYYVEGGGTLLGAYWFCVWSLLFLYVNFSGFMSIAVGSGALFGLKISENFKAPFVSTNIQEFWKRWHVTLGEFANRYMYFPMLKLFNGNPYISIFLTFVLVGIWHAISWQFLAWGVFHGVALATYAWYSRRKKNSSKGKLRVFISKCFGWAITMWFVSWAWTFAAAPTIEGSLRMSAKLIGVDIS